MLAQAEQISRPWYSYPIVWLVIAPPLGSVIAGIITFILIIHHPDRVLDTHAPVAHASSSVMPPQD